jgi:uncharacterized protein (TIGR00369 family)
MEFNNPVERLNEMSSGTLMEALNICYTNFSDGCLSAEMPVNRNSMQPFGLLHGGASLALAESVGSGLSFLSIDNTLQTAVGIEINGNHIRSVKQGNIMATAKFIYKGSSIHVVAIEIFDELSRLVAVCRQTSKILNKEQV